MLPRRIDNADFVAVDFETANRHRSSACAVGVTIVKGGVAIASGSTLINPEVEFNFYNTKVTGIAANMVVDAPTFPDIWPKLSDILRDQLVVAHVATFDGGVLRQSVARYGLRGIDVELMCSWRLARRVWEDLPSYGLGYLASVLELDLDHHDAGSDSAAAASVVQMMALSEGQPTLRSLLDHLEVRTGRMSAESFVGVSSASLVSSDGAGAAESNQVGDQNADPDHPLFGRTLCFTGGMFGMTRSEATEACVAVGASVNTGVSKNVGLLVIGDADFVAFSDGLQTSKMKKAMALREKNHEIEIMAERDFLSLLW
ncbi:exonuclease domain-containing protein [Acidimicrobiaceae bacterium]|nr:exonuclease domain-containing protein [Acidimicrobiaceae bacterium]